MSGKTAGKAAIRPAPSVDADHVEAFSGEPAAEEVSEEAFPFGGALAAGPAKVDDLLLAVWPDAERHQNRALQRAGASFAGKHYAVEHQRGVLVAERPAMEGGDRLVEGLGHLADGRSADLLAKHGKQRLAELAGRQAEHEAGKDDAVNLDLPPGIGADHRGRAEAPGARYAKLDIAEPGQQMASVVAVAPVGGLLL